MSLKHVYIDVVDDNKGSHVSNAFVVWREDEKRSTKRVFHKDARDFVRFSYLNFLDALTYADGLAVESHTVYVTFRAILEAVGGSWRIEIDDPYWYGKLKFSRWHPPAHVVEAVAALFLANEHRMAVDVLTGYIEDFLERRG